MFLKVDKTCSIGRFERIQLRQNTALHQNLHVHCEKRGKGEISTYSFYQIGDHQRRAIEGPFCRAVRLCRGLETEK